MIVDTAIDHILTLRFTNIMSDLWFQKYEGSRSLIRKTFTRNLLDKNVFTPITNFNFRLKCENQK